MKSKAQVCHLNGTNYVDYQGERYTVKDYNKKFKTRVYIPKNVKVCEIEVPEWRKHQLQRAEVEKILDKKKEGVKLVERLNKEVDSLLDIEVPKLRKVEEPNCYNCRDKGCRYCEEWNKKIPAREKTNWYFYVALLIGTLLVLAY